jgi:hypothetical protein
MDKKYNNMNKNFKHKNIATRGGEILEAFITEMRQNGWRGHRGYDGCDEDSYYTIDEDGCIKFDVDIDDYDEVVPREFAEYYRNMLTDKPIDREVYKVTRDEFKKIYDVACYEWKQRLSNIMAEQPFNDKIEVTRQQVKFMLEASTTSQAPIVRAVFHEYDELNMEHMDFDKVFALVGNKALIAINIDDHRSFYLNRNYTWELSTHRDGNQILIPTRK